MKAKVSQSNGSDRAYASAPSDETDHGTASSYRDRKENQVIRYIDAVKYGWRTFPVGLHLSLTDHCYNKCITCGHWVRPNKRRYPLSPLLRLLNFGKERGLESVVYTGGDPFAYGPELNTVM